MTGINVKAVESGREAQEVILDFVPERSALRARITQQTRVEEAACVAALLTDATLVPEERTVADRIALDLARRLRERRNPGLVESLVQEFSLASDEGVALMSLAEALLRTPDKATRDLLIRDQLALGDWLSHTGAGQELLVNAASWGLALTGRVVDTAGRVSSVRRLLHRYSTPVIRAAVSRAMGMMGDHFVLGQTIEEALKNARKREEKGFAHSYDMLGEAALNREDAEAYRAAYLSAIEAVGQAAQGANVYERPGVSVKLSALHPRYFRNQRARVMEELLPVLRELAHAAALHDIGLTIDAEESGRLELSLDLLEALCEDPVLKGWRGLGVVVQAYGKRAPAALDYIIDLARRTQHRLMVRLVKGAYWDSEIKRAQLDGLADFPVFTRKCHTDVSYLACARKLLGARDAVFPQFATHNAHTVAAVYAMAGPAYSRDSYEFQGLHGMGDALYNEVVGADRLGRPCRLYAPVGTHETLLAYLVRRLLENGAHSSFLNLLGDDSISLEKLVEDPVEQTRSFVEVTGELGGRHPLVSLPADLFGEERRNSTGFDFEDESVLRALKEAVESTPPVLLRATPVLAFPSTASEENAGGAHGEHNDALHGEERVIPNPANHDDTVGTVRDATAEEAGAAVQSALAAFPAWASRTPQDRAEILFHAADLLEANSVRLLSLLVREAGKSWPNAVGELREAVDFLRYYGAQVRDSFDNTTHVPLGAMVCISPWNFPLAIFLGQIAAALAGGNTVVAKPSEETPLIALEAVRLMHEAGVPKAVLQMVPGGGEIGSVLVNNPAIAGVTFTGSTAVARLISRALAGRVGLGGQPVPFVAETGGLNSMIVESSALPEQVVGDIVVSAFDSAGQRCSALRLLCVQEEAAPRILGLLKGAMDELTTGNPARLSTDVGPVISEEARDGIAAHIARLRARGLAVHTAPLAPEVAEAGTFVAPTLVELTSIDELGDEVFGPVLHVLRYRREELPELVARINETGYGLTFGVHSRAPSSIEKLVEEVNAGNVYINRNIVGAIVGVQPFGGRGLSGTGPKAGGPLAVRRLLATAPRAPLGAGEPLPQSAQQWLSWLETTDPACAREVEGWMKHGLTGVTLDLPSPVGESNVYRLEPRGRVLALAGTAAGLKRIVSYALSCGNEVGILATDAALKALKGLPAALHKHVFPVQTAQDLKTVSVILTDEAVGTDAEGMESAATTLQKDLLANPEQPLPQVYVADPATLRPEMLLEEHLVSTNTAAAGGNAKLMAVI